MGTKKVTINDMDIELYDKLVKYCKDNKRSLNQGLQHLIEIEMRKYDAIQKSLSQEK